MINFELLRAIRERGLTQRDFARMVEENESKVSLVVNGVWKPNALTKIKWSKALRMKSEDLFKE
jgi:transcriptional regulator with XRE-family HTH domain